MFGNLLSSVIKLANVPIRTIENVVGVDKEEDRIFSKPLTEAAKETKKALDGDDED